MCVCSMCECVCVMESNIWIHWIHMLKRRDLRDEPSCEWCGEAEKSFTIPCVKWFGSLARISLSFLLYNGKIFPSVAKSFKDVRMKKKSIVNIVKFSFQIRSANPKSPDNEAVLNLWWVFCLREKETWKSFKLTVS